MRGEGVINVCFHGLGTPKRELEPGEAPYWVNADAYPRLLDELAGWPSVRISFDDGNASDIEIGLPGLLERGLTADFFVLAGRVGEVGSLGADDLRELLRHGMRVGTHGMTHRSWRGMDEATSRTELVTAREQLAAALGQPVDLAACPLGRYDRVVLRRLRRLGYRRVFTSDRRPSHRWAWLQPRFSVRGHDTAESLRRDVLGQPWYPRNRARAAGLVKRLR